MKRDNAYLLDILDSAQRALDYVSNQPLATFIDDIPCQDMVIRRITLIGEAANQLSEEFAEAHPEVPIREMVGMRNLVVHDYDGIDIPKLWSTVIEDLPKLVASLDLILGK